MAVPKLLNRIKSGEIWRPGQHIEHFVMILKPLLDIFYSVAECIILLKEASRHCLHQPAFFCLLYLNSNDF